MAAETWRLGLDLVSSGMVECPRDLVVGPEGDFSRFGEWGSATILGKMIFEDDHRGAGVMVRLPYSGACLISCRRPNIAV